MNFVIDYLILNIENKFDFKKKAQKHKFNMIYIACLD